MDLLILTFKWVINDMEGHAYAGHKIYEEISVPFNFSAKIKIAIKMFLKCIIVICDLPFFLLESQQPLITWT